MNKFLQEISEQPNSLRDTLNFYVKGEGKVNLERILKIWNVQKFEQIVFAGMEAPFLLPMQHPAC